MAQPFTDTVSKAANGIIPEVKNKAQQAEGYLEKSAGNAVERFGAMASEIEETASDYIKTSRKYVAENPIKGAAIAAAAGVVAGGLLTMLLRSKE